MRNKRLDILRGIAVLLVLFYHGKLQNRLISAGWAGVDLFFVLSGFLISGLLFAEYKRTGRINLKRFFVRRGLKIYPAFYFLLLITLAVEAMTHHVRPLGDYLGELFYVQNYGPSVWTHTWSLAVEEHFYIFLPLILLAFVQWSPHRKDPFRGIPYAFLIIAVVCAAFRLQAAMRIPVQQLSHWENLKAVFEPTHKRIDSLFFGVLIGYLYHFRMEFLGELLRRRRNRIALGTISAVFLSSALLFHSSSRFMLGFGYSWMYLGFGILLLLALQVKNIVPQALGKVTETIGSGIAWLGTYSYSVYLWHLAVLHWQPIFAGRILHVHQNLATEYVSYLAGSIVVGVTMSRLIEFPILRLRDMMYPNPVARSIVAVPDNISEVTLQPAAEL